MTVLRRVPKRQMLERCRTWPRGARGDRDLAQAQGDAAIIAWVNESCKAWGRCTRWILTDTNEGYPCMDTLSRARGGCLEARAQGLNLQYGEVRLAEALEVARAILLEPLMPEALHATLWAQYVVRYPSRERAAAVGKYLKIILTTPEYWRNLDRAHFFLAARIGLPNSKTVETNGTVHKPLFCNGA